MRTATVLKLTSADAPTEAHRDAHAEADRVNPITLFTIARQPGFLTDHELAVEYHRLAECIYRSHPAESDELAKRAELTFYQSALSRIRAGHLNSERATEVLLAVPAKNAAALAEARAHATAEQADAARDAEDLWDQREQALAQDLAEVLGGA